MLLLFVLISCQNERYETERPVVLIHAGTEVLIENTLEPDAVRIRHQDRCFIQDLSNSINIEIEIERKSAYIGMKSELYDIIISSVNTQECMVTSKLPTLPIAKNMGGVNWTETTVSFSITCSRQSIFEQNITIHSTGKIDGLKCNGTSKVLLK
jgi:hypothetical protein